MNYKTYPVSDLIDEIAMGPFGSNIKVDCFVDEGILRVLNYLKSLFAMSQRKKLIH